MRRAVIAGAALAVALFLLLIIGGGVTVSQFAIQARTWNEMDDVPVELLTVIKDVADEQGIAWTDLAAYLKVTMDYRLPIPTRWQIALDNGGPIKRAAIEAVWRGKARAWLRDHVDRAGPDLGAGIPAEKRRLYDDLRQVLAATEEIGDEDLQGWQELTEHETYRPALALLEWHYDMPVRGDFTDDWGNDRPQNTGYASTRHQGTDIFAPRGRAIHSAGDGTIVTMGWNYLGGWAMMVEDASTGARFYYAHMDRYAAGLAQGADVHQGDVIGYVGTTGEGPPGTGDVIAEPHLHVGIYLPAGVTNPYPYLRRWSGIR